MLKKILIFTVDGKCDTYTIKSAPSMKTQGFVTIIVEDDFQIMYPISSIVKIVCTKPNKSQK